MEGNGLFNSGFLGANFLWWVGQIADDSNWRDNISSGKFPNPQSVPGWGRRYKVRIIGLHDKEEESVKSEELPWAQVMYPVTAGSGGGNSAMTSNLRQGMFVFGFFMDGPDQQVPVIMGVMGHNEQTEQKTKTGDNDSNFAATSGFSQGRTPKSEATKEPVPDEAKVTEKPKGVELAKESAQASSNPSKRNKFGVLKGTNLTPEQRADADAERARINEEIARGGALALTPEPERSQTIKILIQQAISEGIANRAREANSPTSETKPGATKEGNANPHLQSAADLIRDNKLREKIPLSKPNEDKVQSAVKNMQTTIETLTTEIDRYLNAITSYEDAVSSKILDLDSVVDKATRDVQKYMKVVFDKVAESSLKTLNESLTSKVSALPMGQRANFSDVKVEITKNLISKFEDVSNGSGDLIKGLLEKALNLKGEDSLESKAREAAANSSPDPYDPNAGISTDGGPRKPVIPKHIKVPICYAEDLVGDILANSREELSKATNQALDGVNEYLKDVNEQVASTIGSGGDGQSDTSGEGGSTSSDDIGSSLLTSLTGGLSQLGGIQSSLTGALQFVNISQKIFDYELPPLKSVSDYYTLDTGAAALPDSILPTAKGIADSAANAIADPARQVVSKIPEVPFAQVPKNAADQLTKERDAIGADLDAELEKAKAGNRDGLDDALDF